MSHPIGPLLPQPLPLPAAKIEPTRARQWRRSETAMDEAEAQLREEEAIEAARAADDEPRRRSRAKPDTSRQRRQVAAAAQTPLADEVLRTLLVAQEGVDSLV
jgi:hypothetical protein